MTAARFTLTIPDLGHDEANELASNLEEDFRLEPMAITINETDESARACGRSCCILVRWRRLKKPRALLGISAAADRAGAGSRLGTAIIGGPGSRHRRPLLSPWLA